MDRRRFIPDPDGLEARIVLSTTPKAAVVTASATTTTTTTTGTLAETIQQRIQRVQNLPFFLESFQPGRFINPDAMKQVQAGLVTLITRLSPPGSQALSNFNQIVRGIAGNTSLSQTDANSLSKAFNRVLAAAHADPAVNASLTSAMQVFAKTDAASINPTYLATNDYSLVLQVALGIGRPLRAPSIPSLITADRVNANVGNVSKSATPTYAGTYEPDSVMSLVNSDGRVLGSAATLSNGQYSIKVATPLPDGNYKLTVRATDSGYVSLPSRVFTLKIKTPTKSAASVPSGPARF